MWKEVYTNKYGMEHLISSLKGKNKITKSTANFLLLEEENLTLPNQIIENHMNIYKMQNLLNTGQKSQINPREMWQNPSVMVKF